MGVLHLPLEVNHLLICGWCNEKVIPTKEIEFGKVILWLLLGVIGVFAYLIYWSGKPGTICPLCGGDVYGRWDELALILGDRETLSQSRRQRASERTNRPTS